MGRRKQSTFEDMIDIASYLPWWLCIVLAVASYFLFHQFAITAIPTAQGPKEISEVINRQLIRSFAIFLQYIVTLIFGFDAIISAVRQWKKESIYKKQTGIESIRQLSWHAFELLISEAFGRQGYKVRETDFGPDGGIDLILNKDGKTILVQCKHWKVYKVGVKPIRELQDVISTKGANGGIFVTSGYYTKDAVDFAIDGDDLNDMFKGIDIEDAEPTVISERLDCPKCGSRMVIRTAKQGINAGKEFWGCSTFPKCKGIVNL
jgi:restriction system protein